VRSNVETAYWFRVTEEEPFLLQSFDIHRDKYTSGTEDHNVLMREAGPFEVQTVLGRVANDVLEFHDWVNVHFG
jgi:hypothetical protein